jgi:DNA-binding IclR family transcriptional regulator
VLPIIMPDPEKAKYVNKSSVRVLRVFSAFTRGKSSWRVSELSEELEMTKNMVFRALKTLVEEGLLVRDASGVRYELGFGVLALRNPGYEFPDIKSLSQSYMERMQTLSGLTVSLHVQIGNSQIVINGIEGSGIVVTRSVYGNPVPLHVSSGSRAILAFLGDEEISDYIRTSSPLEAFTENTIVDPQKLWAEVEEVRKNGFARGLKDHYLEVQAVAFPVLDAYGHPNGSISVVGPDELLAEGALDDLIPRLREIADELNSVARRHLTTPIFEQFQ